MTSHETTSHKMTNHTTDRPLVIETRDLRKTYTLEGGLKVHALRGAE